jgi:LysR family glycine cleavage system transcriptional activator
MRLPPLNALRAFEAAARHENFSHAADELHVTQGAISRHIKLLEARLGAPLFRRRAQGVELTEQGRALLPVLSDCFGRIERALDLLAAEDHEIRVVAAPTVAIRWLIPSLAGFQQRYPDLRVSCGLFRKSFEDFYEGAFDVGLVDTFEFIPPDTEGIDTQLIRREELTPVCAPAFLKASPGLTKPADLKRHHLLHSSEDRRDWSLWLRAAGLDPKDFTKGENLGTLDMALRAAVAGQGIAVGEIPLMRHELESGQLVAPFDIVAREGTGYYLFARQGRFEEPKLAAFRDWILEEAAHGR